jgi:RND superfamily putative drug exporter
MFFHHLGKIATRYRWLIVGIWMVAIAIALPFAPQAGEVLHSGGFVSPDVESERAVSLLEQKLHLNLTIVQVIFTSQRYDAYSPQFIQESQQALTHIRSWSEVSGVVSFTDNPRQISLDRHAAYVNVLLKSDPDSAPKLLPELEHRLQAVPDLKTSIGGGPVFYEDIQAVSERDLRRAEFIAFPFAVIALLLVFRSVVASILPALVGGGAVIVSLALVFALSHITILSIFVLNITTLFGLGLGVDYSLFMVSRFREELAHGRSVEDAVAATVATAGRAVIFSGLTVSIGLFGLTFFRVYLLSSVGIAGVLVVLLAVIAAITLLPAALAIIGPKINAFPVRLPKFFTFNKLPGLAVGALRGARGARLNTSRPSPIDMPSGKPTSYRSSAEFTTYPSQIPAISDPHHGFWYRLSHLVMRYPVQIFLPVLLLLVSLGLPFLGVRFSAPDASILPTNVPSRAAFDLLATRFNARETTPILLAVQTRGNVLTPENIRALYTYAQRIEADPRVARVDCIVSADPRFTLAQYQLLYTHPQLIADPYVSSLLKSSVAGNTTWIQVISKYDMLDQRSQELVLTIRNTLPGSGITVLVDGSTAGEIDYVTSLYTDFPKAILIVAITTYIVLLLFFRSVVLPLKAILMNTLSIMASYGALVVIFQDGFLHQFLGFTPLGFVEATSPILLFCALFGLSMDYEVFLLSRVQEAFWQTGDNTRAVALGLQRSGSIITSAAVIVIVVSASFATADIILVKALGLGMAIAVALDATLVRGLLVPSTMRLLGNVNWWFPFLGVQRRPPFLLENAETLKENKPLDEAPVNDASIGGKR